MKRRTFIHQAMTAGSLAGLSALGLNGCATKGSSATNIVASNKIKIGFIPLTDCASVVMAHELGLYKKHGVDVEVSKEASWAAIRDKLLTGELSAAHCLFGMPFSVYTGIGGTAGQEMKIAMILNNNGQAITLSKDFCENVKFKEIGKVKSAIEAMAKKKPVSFAMTFPGGTHDLWLRYWLAASGVDAGKDSKTVGIKVIPPPQMVANMKAGNMDGYSVGEPWNGVAVKDGIGTTHIASQDIWKHHPEKALVVNKQFSETKRDELKKIMQAILEASVWLDKPENRKEAAGVVGKQSYVNAPPDVIEARLLGKYDLGCDQKHDYTDDFMMFSRGGATNYPRKAHAIWFLAQYVRFGYLPAAPDYKKVADTLILQDLYTEVAKSMNIAIPDDDMKPFTIDLDKSTFNPNNPVISKAAGTKA
jgi:nitrate/nitrite transport system substrate-binding protein